MLQLAHSRLEVWKKSIDLVMDIYAISEGFPKSEQYGLMSQMRRAAVSVASNIAEGAARSSPLEKKRFFEMARSSLSELDTQLIIAKRLMYLDGENNEVYKKLHTVFALLSGLIASLQRG